MTQPRPFLSHRDRLHVAQFLVLVLVVFLVLPQRPASAGVNLIANPGLESIAADGFPVCWEQSGYGDNGYRFEISTDAHSGARSMAVTLTNAGQGDRKAMMLEDTSCAPNVTPGHQYDLSAWYQTSTPNTVMTMLLGTMYCFW